MTLTTLPFDQFLDLPDYRGQRVERFEFHWINGVTGEIYGTVTPEKGSPPSLTHTTTSGIKRRLTMNLGVNFTSQVNPITDRILPYMIVGGTTWPLGRYMFSTDTKAISTRGDRGSYTLLDEGFIVDQQIQSAFAPNDSVTGAVLLLLTGLPLPGVMIEASPYPAAGAFNIGQTRGQILDAYATQGDYFPYWFDNTGNFHMIRTRDPGVEIPDFNYDVGNKITRDSIALTSDILTAFNKFIVVSNAGEAQGAALVGTYEVPPSAPHSIANRGFVLSTVFSIQAASQGQVSAAAKNLGIRSTVYERISLETALDPRHDSYNIIRFRGVNWLELSWSMELIAGGKMQHTMRKAYT